MIRTMLRGDQWERIAPLLPGKASDPGRTARDNRCFIEAVLWIMRTGQALARPADGTRPLAPHIRALLTLA